MSQELERLRELRCLFQRKLEDQGGACDLGQLGCKSWKKRGAGLGSLKDFLKAYPEHFDVAGDRVRLLCGSREAEPVLLPVVENMLDAFRGELRRRQGRQASCLISMLGDLPRWRDHSRHWGRLSDFLACFPQIFCLEGDHVSLCEGTGKNRSITEILENPIGRRDHPGTAIVGHPGEGETKGSAAGGGVGGGAKPEAVRTAPRRASLTPKALPLATRAGRRARAAQAKGRARTSRGAKVKEVQTTPPRTTQTLTALPPAIRAKGRAKAARAKGRARASRARGRARAALPTRVRELKRIRRRTSRTLNGLPPATLARERANGIPRVSRRTAEMYPIPMSFASCRKATANISSELGCLQRRVTTGPHLGSSGAGADKPGSPHEITPSAGCGASSVARASAPSTSGTRITKQRARPRACGGRRLRRTYAACRLGDAVSDVGQRDAAVIAPAPRSTTRNQWLPRVTSASTFPPTLHAAVRNEARAMRAACVSHRGPCAVLRR